MQPSFLIALLVLFSFISLSNISKAKAEDNLNAQEPMVIAAAEQGKFKNYAPFMRNLVASARSMAPAQKTFKAAKIVRGGKQVIVLGAP